MLATMRRSLCALALFAFLSGAVLAAPKIVQGEIEGAKFTIARPTQWNRRLLLLAHGHRLESEPLSADLNPNQTLYKTLLDAGWMVATTSYRRNGLIISDAVADIDALRAHIEKTYGRPERVLLEGESIGGLIATLIAEREPDEPRSYDGAVAIGAALGAREDRMTLSLDFLPQMPLIFLTNQSELEGPKQYVLSRMPRPKIDLRPALFIVARSGHVNVNDRERLTALRALDRWIEEGRETLPTPAEGTLFFDATSPPEPQPSRVKMQDDGHGFDAQAVEITAGYGNVLLDAQPADFAAAGIKGMTWFKVTANGRNYRVFYGRDLNNVKRGEWVAFANGDGFIWLARNAGDAAKTAGLKPGTVISLHRYDEPASPETER
jgi:pimeloyl-ACP methyl ester carboxylesterase